MNGRKLNEQCEQCARKSTVAHRRELVFSELKRKSKIRIIFKDFPVADMAEILERFKSVLNERITEEEERIANDSELKKSAENILSEMAERGIDVELLKELQQQRGYFASSRVRYVKDGATWTGLGRRPAPFKGLSDYELEKYRKQGEDN